MTKEDILSTLFVGIDVGARTNSVCAMDFFEDICVRATVPNNLIGAAETVSKLTEILDGSNGKFVRVIVALESTSVYGMHIACSLSTDKDLLRYNVLVYCLNPRATSAYKKSLLGTVKTDPADAKDIADYIRTQSSKVTFKQKPWRGTQFLALQRLSRHRLHLADNIAREKSYMLNNIFLKFSELAIAPDDRQPFSNTFGATAEAVLRNFLSTDEIVSRSPQELVEFVNKYGHKHFADPEETVKLLQSAAKYSYRLDKCLYEPLTISITSSFNCVSAFEKEIKVIDKALVNAIKGFNTNEYDCLLSIPGIGKVYASGILSEIGSITNFKTNDAIAKYAGLVWNRDQSGDFLADETHMSKNGNSYLRYYLIEAANSVRRSIPEYADFYQKKFDEAATHKHSRAVALTARKLIRLIFVLLDENQLYTPKKV